MDISICMKPTPDSFMTWLDHRDNPAHGRYARYFLSRPQEPPLTSVHNCLVGDHGKTVSYWQRWAKSNNAFGERVRDLAGITEFMNHETRLWAGAEDVMVGRFWFIFILEKMDQSVSRFCRLGKFEKCGSRPPRNEGLEHKSGRPPRFTMTPETEKRVRYHNQLDIHLYEIALSYLN